MPNERRATDYAEDENTDVLIEEDAERDDVSEGEHQTSATAGAVVPDAPQTVVVKGLRKEFTSGDEVISAVDGVSFSLPARQLVAITGPSGCGKTTLLYLLGSLEKPTAGHIVIDGIDVAGLSGRDVDVFRRQKIGFVFQSFHLIPNLSALENVMLPMEIANVPRASRRARAEYLLRRVGIAANRQDHRPGKLSGGQQQRVAIARALANEPSVLLADEPTGNLDSRTSKVIVTLLRTLAKQGCTVIIVTHDRSIAHMADVHMELMDGQIASVTNQADARRALADSSVEQQRRSGGDRRRNRKGRN